MVSEIIQADESVNDIFRFFFRFFFFFLVFERTRAERTILKREALLFTS